MRCLATFFAAIGCSSSVDWTATVAVDVLVTDTAIRVVGIVPGHSFFPAVEPEAGLRFDLYDDTGRIVSSTNVADPRLLVSEFGQTPGGSRAGVGLATVRLRRISGELVVTEIGRNGQHDLGRSRFDVDALQLEDEARADSWDRERKP